MKRPSGVIAAVAIGVLAAACSGDSSSDSTAPADPTTTAAATITTTTAPPSIPAEEVTTTAAAAPEVVTFLTSDGRTLEGRIIGSGSTWVVLGHMFPADMTSWFGFAAEAASAGYTALAYNNRGYGESDGDKNDPRVATDAIAAVELARSRGADRIFYFGASMNGAAALAVAATDTLAGIATLSGVSQFGDTNGIDVIASVAEPKVFIAAQDDFGAVDDAQQFFDLASEPKQLLVFDVGGHGTDMFEENGPLLTETLLGFLADHG